MIRRVKNIAVGLRNGENCKFIYYRKYEKSL